MMAKFLLFAVFAVLFVNNHAADIADIEIFENEFKSRLEKVNEIAEEIKNASTTYKDLTEERLNTINYLYTFINEKINYTSEKGVSEGVKHKRWFGNFECLVDSSNKARGNLNKIYGNYPENTKKLIEKNIFAALRYRLVGDNLQSYILEMYKTKKKEISRTSDPNTVKKILEEVFLKLKVLDKILSDLESQVFKLKFSFFQNFVTISYKLESEMKKVLDRDVPKILKCMVW